MKQFPQTRVTRYIFSTFITNLILGGSGFILAVIFARVLGPEGKGYITAIILWPTVLASIFSFGYVHANTYQAANNRLSGSKLVTNSFIMFLAVTPLALIIGWLGLPIFFKSTNIALLQASKIGLLAIPLLLLQGFLSGLLVGWNKIDHRNILRIIEKVGLLLVILGLIFLQNISLKVFVVALIIICLMTTIVALYFVLRSQVTKFIGDRKLFSQTIKYGLKSYLGSIGEWGNLRLDQLMMAALFTASSLGIYSVAVTITEALWLLAFAVSMVVFPATSALSEDDAVQLTAKASRVTFFMLLGLGVFIFLIAPKLVSFVFGPKFIAAGTLIKVLLPGGIAFGLGRVIASGLMGINQPSKASISQITALVSTIFFAPPLIIFYGAIGAAIASDIAYGTYLSIALYYFLKKSRLSLKDVFIVRRSDFDVIQKKLQTFTIRRKQSEQ